MALYRLDDHAPDLPEPGSFWIAETALVVGRVRIGRDVGIWFGTVVRADDERIEIGEGTNVQDNSVLHADPGYPLLIGRNCTIGHKVTLHGCVIGDNSLIGMSATIMNGARIGANCVVGAHSLITENKVIPDNYLVIGAPAKAVRELDDAAVRKLPDEAAAYVRKWRRYARGLGRLS